MPGSEKRPTTHVTLADTTYRGAARAATQVRSRANGGFSVLTRAAGRQQQWPACVAALVAVVATLLAPPSPSHSFSAHAAGTAHAHEITRTQHAQALFLPRRSELMCLLQCLLHHRRRRHSKNLTRLDADCSSFTTSRRLVARPYAARSSARARLTLHVDGYFLVTSADSCFCSIIGGSMAPHPGTPPSAIHAQPRDRARRALCCPKLASRATAS